MKIALIVVGALVVLGLIGFAGASYGLSDIQKMVIEDVDLSTVPDGVYTGRFQKARWTHEVKVTVKDHRITAIENTNRLPDEARRGIVEKAIEAMLAKQSVDIDVVSGATVNTKAFQKAVENALGSR